MRSTKNFEFKIKAQGSDGSFEGLLAVYNNVDLGNDLIEPGAFTKSIQERGNFIPLLWQHDPDKPIGSLQLVDGPDALRVKGQLLMEIPQANTAYSLIKAKIIKGLSIGYDSLKDSVEGGVRHLKELRLWEGSVVTFPMNEAATISNVKSLDDAKRILSEVAAHREDVETISALRSLLKDVSQLLDDDDECDCGAENDEECTCDEDAEDEKQAAMILRNLVIELKSRVSHSRAR